MGKYCCCFVIADVALPDSIILGVHPSTTPPPSADNTHATAAIATQTNYDNSTNPQPSLAHTSSITLHNNTDNNINFTSAAAMEKIPSREHAIVFNSIDGIPQIQYVLAIGKIVQPNNIKFVSRILNNRFCSRLLISTTIT